MSTEGTAPIQFVGGVDAAPPAPECVERPAAEAYPVADFFEPVQFTWTEAGYEAHKALERFNEATDADYSDTIS